MWLITQNEKAHEWAFLIPYNWHFEMTNLPRSFILPLGRRNS